MVALLSVSCQTFILPVNNVSSEQLKSSSTRWKGELKLIYRLLWRCFGIDAGDKEAHRLSLHFPQLLYFGLATAAMLSPLYLAPRRAWAWVKSGESFFGYALAFGIALVFVHYFTYTFHPVLRPICTLLFKRHKSIQLSCPHLCACAAMRTPICWPTIGTTRSICGEKLSLYTGARSTCYSLLTCCHGVVFFMDWVGVR